jgi:hypothetical protein
MPTLLPWTSVEVGDVDIFAPALPCLVVYTWYVGGQPESTVTYFWQDKATGIVRHELVFMEPVTFDAAVAWSQEHAPKRGIERIHVKHARTKSKVGQKTKSKRAANAGAARPNKRGAAKRKAAKAPVRGRNRSSTAA